MGATFVTVDMEREVSADGYAKEMTAQQQAATATLYDQRPARPMSSSPRRWSPAGRRPG